MSNAIMLKEYLVGLGLRDNMTPQLRRSISRASRSIRSFAKGAVTASIAMTGLMVAANAGLVRFTTGLVRTDDEVRRFAEELGKTREEAARLHFTLQTMGKSMEEIEASPELLRTFRRLQEDARAIQLPDMSEGLEQVRGIQTEFLRLRQLGTHALQWVGHHFLKYIAHPMEKLRGVFSGLNESIIRNMPEWSKSIASVMGSVVNITTATIRGAGAVFRAIRSIFDMIPAEIRVLTGVLTGFMTFIKAGPIGKMMMLFTVLMLLVEDFFTYLDGGEALLGGLWRMLINLWSALNEGGGVIDRLRATFISAMEVIGEWIDRAIGWVRNLWKQLRESDALDNFRNAFERVGSAIGRVFQALRDVFGILVGDTTPFLVWLISEALPNIIGLFADIVGRVAGAVSWFAQLKGAREIIIALAGAIGAVVAAMKIYNAYLLVTTKLQAALNAIKMLNPKVAIIAAIIAAVALLIRNWEGVAGFFRSLWDRITGIFRTAIDGIVGFFRGIPDTVLAVWETVKAGVQAFIAAIIGFFVWLIEGIGEKIGFIVGIFSSAWDTARDLARAFIDSVLNIFRPLTDFLSGIGDRIRSIFGGRKTLNVDANLNVSEPSAGHAEGGIFDKEHVARFAEGNRAEAVVPLTKPSRAREVLAGIASYLGGAREMLGSMQTRLNQPAPSYTTYVTNNYDNRVYNNDMKSNYNINDTSGKPKSVASAVDRTKHLQLRNLQGVLNTG